MLLFTATILLSLVHHVTSAVNVTSRTAPVGATVLTVAVIGGPYEVLLENSDIDHMCRLWMDWLGSIP